MGSNPSKESVSKISIPDWVNKLETWEKVLLSEHGANVDDKEKENEIQKVMDIIKILRMEMDGMRMTVGESSLSRLQRAEKEKADLLNRLSSVASDRMRNKNPKIADLSDTNRPTKLAERFSELYDNEWTDAFLKLKSECATNGNNHEVEKDAIGTLLNILKICYTKCTNEAKIQHDDLGKLFFGVKGEKQDQSYELRINECQKQIAEITIKDLQKDCRDRLERWIEDKKMTLKLKEGDKRKIVKCLNTDPGIKYAEVCVELTWRMGVHDPPVILEFESLMKDISQHFRPYTRSGREVEFVVWPVVYIHKNGPILTKGVIQFKGQDQKEKKESSVKSDKNRASKQGNSQATVVSSMKHKGDVQLEDRDQPDESVTSTKVKDTHANADDEQVSYQTKTTETTSNTDKKHTQSNVKNKDKSKTQADAEVSKEERSTGTIPTQSSQSKKKGFADPAGINVHSDVNQIIDRNKKIIDDI